MIKKLRKYLLFILLFEPYEHLLAENSQKTPKASKSWFYENRKTIFAIASISFISLSFIIYFLQSSSTLSIDSPTTTKTEESDENICKDREISIDDDDPIIKKILSNPLELLQECNNKYKEYLKELPQISFPLIKHYQKEIIVRNKWTEKIYPIFFLDECKGEYCEMRRDKNPQFRFDFEKKVSEVILGLLRKKKSLNYASFGSGTGLFTDFIILSRVLSAFPTASLHISLIDHCHSYELLSNLKKKIKQAKKELGNQFNYDEAIHEFEQEQKAKNHIDLDGIIVNIGPLESALYQIKKFINTRFPQAHAKIKIYGSANDYIENINHNDTLSPAVLIACDIIEDRHNTRPKDKFLELVNEIKKNTAEINTLILDFDGKTRQNEEIYEKFTKNQFIQ